MKPNFRPHPNESLSGLIARIYRHIRTLDASQKPISHNASRIKTRKVMRPKLRLVK